MLKVDRVTSDIILLPNDGLLKQKTGSISNLNLD